jgi:hypothetical protein
MDWFFVEAQLRACFDRHPSQPGYSDGNQNLEPLRTQRSAEEKPFCHRVALMSTDFDSIHVANSTK